MLKSLAFSVAVNVLQHGLLPLSSPSLAKCAIMCIRDISCSSFFYQQHQHLCYMSDLVYVASTMVNAQGMKYYSWKHSSCPVGYIYSRAAHLCYKQGSGMTWYQAQAECQDDGGRMVKIDSPQKQDVIRYLASAKGHTWTGLKQTIPGSGVFKWTDGSLVNYTDWHVGQPNQAYSCVVNFVVSSTDPPAWHNGMCTLLYRVMCEIPI